MKKEENKIYIIPKNYEDSLVTASGRSFRNIIEGGILGGIGAGIFAFFPIPTRLKIILMLVCGSSLFLIGFLGINNYSLSEYAKMFVKFCMSNKVYDQPPKTIFYNEIVEVIEKKDVIEKSKKSKSSNKQKIKKEKKGEETIER